MRCDLTFSPSSPSVLPCAPCGLVPARLSGRAPVVRRQALDHKGASLPASSLLNRIRRLANSVGLRSIGACGLSALPGGLPVISRTDGKASLKGVSRCGSAWSCPVCAPRLASKRALALSAQIGSTVADGWKPWLLTLTLRHHQGSRLSALLPILAKAWGRLTSGRAWAALKKTGVEFVRGYDFTHGASGWHPHIHAVFVFGPLLADPAAAAQGLLDRWQSILLSLGAEALPGGLDAQPCSDAAKSAAYALAIAGVWESVGSPTKQAKAHSSRTVWDLARGAVAGVAADAALWTEYAQATKGRRAVVVSQSFDLDAKPEQRSGEGSDDPPVEIVAFVRPSLLSRLDPHLGDILASAAAVGAEAARRLLREALGPPGPSAWFSPETEEPPSG